MSKIRYSCYSILVALTLLAGCKSSALQTPEIPKAMVLRSIGTETRSLFNSELKITTFPKYSAPIRLGIQISDFNHKTQSKYFKVNPNNIHRLEFVDSIAEKPKFLILSIADQVSAIKALSSEANSATLQYLKNHSDAHMITTISITMPVHLRDEVMAAEAVFLINPHYKQYAISLVKSGKSYRTIPFTTVTVFEYQASSFCWGENDKNKISIMNIVDQGSSCSKPTFNRASKAEKKMKYLKL